jgi:protocatechuate 3,4-dioxygenase beta subunit
VKALPVLVAVLAAAAALAGFAAHPGAAGAASCAATPQDSFGPFGRGMPPLRGSIGHGHVLTGTILSAAGCRPIAGARVELWQEDANGDYTRASSATVVTDRNGRFRFEGPLPPGGDGFPPHIHIRVLAPGFKPLLTRYEIAGGSKRGSVALVLAPEAL